MLVYTMYFGCQWNAGLPNRDHQQSIQMSNWNWILSPRKKRDHSITTLSLHLKRKEAISTPDICNFSTLNNVKTNGETKFELWNGDEYAYWHECKCTMTHSRCIINNDHLICSLWIIILFYFLSLSFFLLLFLFWFG